MLLEGKVGPVAAADQTVNELRLTKDTAVVTQHAHARYQEAVYRGSVFSAANQASQALTAVGTAMTGFVLYNPINSGKNLVLWEVDIALSAAVAGTASAQVISLAGAVGPNVAAPTSTTALTIVNNLLNPASTAVAKAYSTSTTVGVTPTIIKPLFGLQAATAVGLAIFQFDDEIAGQIVIPPGVFVCLAFTGGAAPSAISSMTWEEIPI